MKTVKYAPMDCDKSDRTKKFETEQECQEYIFSQMCQICKDERELYFEMVQNGYSHSDGNLPEIYRDSSEYPGCYFEWAILDERQFGQMECESCGGFFDLENISYGPDPFAEEIHHDDTKMYLCDECYQTSSEEI